MNDLHLLLPITALIMSGVFVLILGLSSICYRLERIARALERPTEDEG